MDFRVAGVSQNTNSFGLREMLLVSRCGKGMRVLANSLNVRTAGDTITLDAADLPGSASWQSFECPRVLPDAPVDVVAEVWVDAKKEACV